MTKTDLKNNFAFWKYKNSNITSTPCHCQTCEGGDINLENKLKLPIQKSRGDCSACHGL